MMNQLAGCSSRPGETLEYPEQATGKTGLISHYKPYSVASLKSRGSHMALLIVMSILGISLHSAQLPDISTTQAGRIAKLTSDLCFRMLLEDEEAS